MLYRPAAIGTTTSKTHFATLRRRVEQYDGNSGESCVVELLVVHNKTARELLAILYYCSWLRFGQNSELNCVCVCPVRGLESEIHFLAILRKSYYQSIIKIKPILKKFFQIVFFHFGHD